jgi:ribosome-associated heat shock protein Hsp15
VRAGVSDAGHDKATPVADGGETFLRLDQWLWYVRFYKSRSQATTAVAGGRVHLNGARVKPAHPVRAGDRIEASVGLRQVEVVVLALPSRRGPAPEARRCFEETAASVARGAQQVEQRRMAGFAGPMSAGRPDKRDRRRLAALARRQLDS